MSPISRLLAGHVAVAMVAAGLFACTEDSSDDDYGGGGSDGLPTLNILANTGCGNLLPIPLPDELRSNTMVTADVVVQGIDPTQDNSQILPGTDLLIFIGNDDGNPGGSGGRFTSNPRGDVAASQGVKFSGGQGSDRFFCTSRGVVTLHAALGTIKDGKFVKAAYEPAAGETIRTPVAEGFPVQCIARDDWIRQCRPKPDTDAGDAEADAEPDAADAGSDAEAGPDMDSPPQWSLEYAGPQADQLEVVIRGAFRQGVSDNINLTFKVTESGGVPTRRIPVTFSLGSSRPANAAVEPPMATTNAEGLVTVQFRAGGTPGVVSVEATARFPEGLEQTVQSPPILIRAGTPSQRGMGFACEHPVMSAFATRTGNALNEWGLALNEKNNCTVQLADRLGGRVDQAVQVFFLSEAGNMAQAAQADDQGVAQSELRSGPPVPRNVQPLEYETAAGLVAGDFNPRDGLVRLIAVTRGEEAFTDRNGDLIFDPGVDLFEPAHDLPEPFVDENDNGQHDEGENFRDLNNDDVWTPSNGVWDNNTEIWEDTAVLWIGELVTAEDDSRSFFRMHECEGDDLCFDEAQGNAHAGCPEDLDFYLSDRGSALVAMRFVDSNGNCLDSFDQGDVTLSTSGPIEVFPQAARQFSIEECFTQGCTTGCPVPAIYVARIFDPTPLPPVAPPMPGQPPTPGPPPEPVEVVATVKYQRLGGESHEVAFTLQGCVQ